jgi:hypothetical protein
MTTIGCILIVLAACLFVFKAYVSFTSEGGTLGMVPVLDGAIFPPTLALFGLHLVLPHPLPLKLSDFAIYTGLWMASVFLAGAVIIVVGNLGKRTHKRRKTPKR